MRMNKNKPIAFDFKMIRSWLKYAYDPNGKPFDNNKLLISTRLFIIIDIKSSYIDINNIEINVSSNMIIKSQEKLFLLKYWNDNSKKNEKKKKRTLFLLYVTLNVCMFFLWLPTKCNKMWWIVHISILEYSYEVHATRRFPLITFILLSVPRYTCTCMQSLKKNCIFKFLLILIFTFAIWWLVFFLNHTVINKHGLKYFYMTFFTSTINLTSVYW